ncbi:hypothetical protein PSHT_12206 [Puccinia striiformis]|uniref:Uncharacterized protein n=1 Tax=Puccinia striiformis TaxID=27350 RepID=A0A2S4UY82_9BASI|nr:hypothetical protein PSHT_12206 [Puccinia striiformis]
MDDGSGSMLANIICLVCSTTQSDKEDAQSEITELDKPIIHLARSAIPIFKLSRNNGVQLVSERRYIDVHDSPS